MSPPYLPIVPPLITNQFHPHSNLLVRCHGTKVQYIQLYTNILWFCIAVATYRQFASLSRKDLDWGCIQHIMMITGSLKDRDVHGFVQTQSLIIWAVATIYHHIIILQHYLQKFKWLLDIVHRISMSLARHNLGWPFGLPQSIIGYSQSQCLYICWFFLHLSLFTALLCH
jgi:hypothetical protein